MWVDFCSPQSFRCKINTEGGERGTQILVAPKSKYPPAEPGALGCEPLKAAERGR